MKPHPKHQLTQSTKPISAFRRMSLLLTSAVILSCLAITSKAANILVNPAFGASPLFTAGSWTQHASESWSMSQGLAQTPDALIYPGSTNSLWMQGLYGNGQGGPQTSYAAQDFSCIAGNTYSADAWYSAYVSGTYPAPGIGGSGAGGSGFFANDGANEDGWVEVLFYNSSAAVVADYKSTIITPAFDINAGDTLTLVTNAVGNVYLPWEDFPVTNQYDPTTLTANSDPALDTAGITNTLGSGQYITAPPGAVKVEFRINLFQNANEAGAPFWDNATLSLVGGPSASVIGDLSPDGTKFFNGSATNFTFTVTSQAAGGATLPTNPTGGVQVIVNGINESSGLQFSGTPTALKVTLPSIYSNEVYNISISSSNSAGLVANSSVVFDTFPTNAFIVNSEDYDYTNGQFIQNPIPTNGAAAYSYWGTAGTAGVDQNAGASVTGGGSTLAPDYPNRTDGNVAFQATGDIPLPLYSAQNNAAVYGVALSYNNGGDWCNYTRDPYPQGTYYVYGRLSGGAGLGEESLNLLASSGYGTATQTTNQLGEFILPNGQNWSSFEWIPLTDAFGNQVTVNIPAGRQTLQLLSGGGENFAFFIFVPVSGVLPPAIGNLTPAVNSANNNIFVSATNLTFTVSSSSSTIAQSGVQTFLNGVNISAKESFTGYDTNWLVSIPLPANKIVNLVVNAADAGGLSNSISETFDTFSQSNFMVNAVDYDFSGGQFIDNPVPTGNSDLALATVASDSYYYWPEGNNANAAIAGVDYTATTAAGYTLDYRALDIDGTQPATDFLLQKFIDNNATEFNIGYWVQGEWFNYTRTYPTNQFYVYGRLANNGAFSGVTLSQVTSGQGTPTQATTVLGSFASATGGGGYQSWIWVPMLGTNGQPAVISLGGVETLRLTGGTGQNANYFMLVAANPAVNLSASVSGGKIVLNFPTQQGSSYTLLESSSLTGGSWQPVGTAISGSGSALSVTNTVSAGQEFYKLLITN
jgi:hypothetical protein